MLNSLTDAWAEAALMFPQGFTVGSSADSDDQLTIIGWLASAPGDCFQVYFGASICDFLTRTPKKVGRFDRISFSESPETNRMALAAKHMNEFQNKCQLAQRQINPNYSQGTLFGLS